MIHRKLVHSKCEAANILNLAKAYFYTCNKLLFNFFMYHGKSDLVKGYRYYKEYQRKMDIQFNDIFYKFDTTYQLAIFIKPYKIYRNIPSACISLDKLLVNHENNLYGLRTIKKVIRKVSK